MPTWNARCDAYDLLWCRPWKHSHTIHSHSQWLLKMEEELCAETIDEESVGIDLNEVYERLDEMEADKVSGCGPPHHNSNRVLFHACDFTARVVHIVCGCGFPG